MINNLIKYVERAINIFSKNSNGHSLINYKIYNIKNKFFSNYNR